MKQSHLTENLSKRLKFWVKKYNPLIYRIATYIPTHKLCPGFKKGNYFSFNIKKLNFWFAHEKFYRKYSENNIIFTNNFSMFPSLAGNAPPAPTFICHASKQVLHQHHTSLNFYFLAYFYYEIFLFNARVWQTEDRELIRAVHSEWCVSLLGSMAVASSTSLQ